MSRTLTSFLSSAFLLFPSWFSRYVLSAIGVIIYIANSHNAIAAQQTDASPFNIPRTQTIQLDDADRAYDLFIKLPKGYNSDANQHSHYPVIYITDAMYAFQIISGATRYPMNSNAMQQAILVGVSWQKGLRGDKSRVRNYTPSVDKSWKKQTGGADRYVAFLQQKVLPYIQQHFRTEPSQRTYVGNSLGGLLGAYILLEQPEMFSNYVLGSPSFWWHKQMIFKLTQQRQEALSKIKANVFIGIGELEHNGNGGFSNFDMVGDAQQFKALLDRTNSLISVNRSSNKVPNKTITSKLLIINDASHETAFPTSAIQGIYWLFNLKNGVSSK
ncbi:alpha/beta hydrolase [Shewanella sp. GutDb-MelDb]|uniref:alpha/beta hydrolase n=1 Tax=Shewanella sp. GutDb-MelDb TaxID=2058316 RepID=UPI000C7D5F70|nr:alpha/beta hydrolase-fold protein [Shewanella sp. GutDb-MelDb]PKG56738.1 esterase [Shewanella sp. GutDb-MelDb]